MTIVNDDLSVYGKSLWPFYVKDVSDNVCLVRTFSISVTWFGVNEDLTELNFSLISWLTILFCCI